MLVFCGGLFEKSPPHPSKTFTEWGYCTLFRRRNIVVPSLVWWGESFINVVSDSPYLNFSVWERLDRYSSDTPDSGQGPRPCPLQKVTLGTKFNEFLPDFVGDGALDVPLIWILML